MHSIGGYPSSVDHLKYGVPAHQAHAMRLVIKLSSILQPQVWTNKLDGMSLVSMRMRLGAVSPTTCR